MLFAGRKVMMRIVFEEQCRKLCVCLCMVLMFAVSGAALQVYASAITDDLKIIVDKVVGVLTDPKLKGPEKKQERNRLIHGIADEKFDWEEMAKRSIGVRWRDLSPQQQKEFIDVFVDFLERTYISKIDLFLQKTAGFSSKNIIYPKETIEGRYALVESKIAVNEQEIPLNYKLIDKNGKWVVYDLTVEGIGLVANYRTQFNEILANTSFNDLIKKLKEKEGTDIMDKKTGQGTDNGTGQQTDQKKT